MNSPENPTLERFEQLCHDVSNPLMVIWGQAYLLERRVGSLQELPPAECARIVAELAHIAQSVEHMARVLERYRGALSEAASDA